MILATPLCISGGVGVTKGDFGEKHSDLAKASVVIEELRAKAVKHEAEISLKLLNNHLYSSFEQLFIQNHSIEVSYDSLIR